MFDAALGEVFTFTEADLQHNQQRQISPAQQARFEATNQSCLALSALVSIIMVMVIGVLLIAQADTGLIFTIGVFAALAVLALIFAWQTRDDVYYAHTIEGEAQLRTDQREGASRYVLNIHGYEFSLTPRQYEVIQDGVPYAVHYASTKAAAEKPGTKILLSVEKKG